SKILSSLTRRDIKGSDHGPIVLELNKDINISERPIYEKREQISLF
ncbi:MAG: hypothetical protein RI945_402, partial [Candidatus Parcubacteria bacterium]